MKVSPYRIPGFGAAMSISRTGWTALAPPPHAGPRDGGEVHPYLEISEYDWRWPAVYEVERQRILQLAGARITAIEHFGSTSVPRLCAKPVIDIVVGLAQWNDAEGLRRSLAAFDYRRIASPSEEWHILGRTGSPAFRVHLVPHQSRRWKGFLAVRDYLRSDSRIASEYCRLKKRLAAIHHTDRLKYHQGKRDFLTALEERAIGAIPRSRLTNPPAPKRPLQDLPPKAKVGKELNGTVEPASKLTVADIRVVDDFLPIYDELAEMIKRECLVYGWRSSSTSDPHGHWNRNFAKGAPANLADVSGDLSGDPRLAPVKRAWEFLRDRELPDGILIRCYLNGYTYGTDGYFHADSGRPDEHTTVIFMNDHWEPDWAGETVFLDERGELRKSVLPKRNRAVIFASGIQHAGRGVSRKCTELRKTLIFKARRRRSANFEKLSSFLREAGAAELGHRSGALHDHLVRVFSLLEARGFADSVCFAGGLHSIYGTNAYRAALLSSEDRGRVADEFGARAEELAALFANLEGPKTLESPLKLTEQAAWVELRTKETMMVDRATFDALRLMACADLADQNELNEHKTLSAIWQAIRI